MGIQLTWESEEEKANARHNKAKKRAIVLAALLGVALLARFAIEDPPLYKKVDVSQVELRYVPGVLENMTASEREKLDPTILARLERAQAAHLAAVAEQRSEADGSPGTYAPAEPPPEVTSDVAAYKEQVYQYELRRKQMEEIRRQIKFAEAVTKPGLVMFRGGGFIRVDEAERHGSRVHARAGRMLFDVPKKWVRTISNDAREWRPPVPRGYVRLRPARGITITVSKRISRRIDLRNGQPS